MKTIRLILSFPIAFATYAAGVTIFTLGWAFFIGEEKIRLATIPIDALTALVCVIVGASIAPRDKRLTVTYVLSALPLYVVAQDAIKTMVHQQPMTTPLQELIGTAVGIAGAWIFVKRRTATPEASRV